ncbi:MAG: hypothetical protein D6B27_12425 [Gammaproteobacteria bacterium]|nr:MAG: hypothetical protein D6B27_12425 [Gammaproteobacteria bacterium]
MAYVVPAFDRINHNHYHANLWKEVKSLLFFQSIGQTDGALSTITEGCFNWVVEFGAGKFIVSTVFL